MFYPRVPPMPHRCILIKEHSVSNNAPILVVATWHTLNIDILIQARTVCQQPSKLWPVSETLHLYLGGYQQG